MTKLAVIHPDFTPDQVDLIKRTICEGATDDELALFMHQARKTGLDPLARQIYFQKYRDNKTGKYRVSILTAIDGYRVIAARTGLYAGSDDPVFDNEDKPTKATITVYKMIQGQKCGFTASARWEQYYPGDTKGFMWKKMPHLMLGKVAEALALRKAFPAELSGTYTETEMEQAEAPSVEAEVIETYTGTAQQNAKLKTWCDEYSVEKSDKPKILKEILGKSMLEAHEVVKKFEKKPEF